MAKGGFELVDRRRQEIMDACEKIYKDKNLNEINIKDISEITSFTRTSIYNYFSSKEEIFLSMFEREFSFWADELEPKIHDNMSKEEFCEMISTSLQNRPTLLKIWAMNMYETELNSSFKNIVSFKKEYKRVIDLLIKCIDNCVVNCKISGEDFIYIFCPFVMGVFPYTSLMEVQKRAMDTVGIDYKEESVHDFIFRAVKYMIGE